MGDRPNFKFPLPAGMSGWARTYVGHNPDDKKMDIYPEGRPAEGCPVVAAAAGTVHEQFYPGGIEINHGGGWFTTYMHMSSHVPVGTRVAEGQQIGVIGDVGTGVFHLHHEQLFDAGGVDAGNEDIVNPVIEGQGPLVLVPGDPGKHFTSTAGKSSPPPVSPPPVKPNPAARPAWPGSSCHYLSNGHWVPFGGSGENFDRFGLITDPSVHVHGGHPTIDGDDVRAAIKLIQQQLIRKGYVPGVNTPASGWADGKFEQPTKDAVIRFQRQHMPGTTKWGEVWNDDWAKLFSL